jgi:hypothetical protein
MEILHPGRIHSDEYCFFVASTGSNAMNLHFIYAEIVFLVSVDPSAAGIHLYTPGGCDCTPRLKLHTPSVERGNTPRRCVLKLDLKKNTFP